MPSFAFKKLVRDNIWAWHEEEGHIVVGRALAGKELTEALKDKLAEEVSEVKDTSSQNELIEELADVMQVVKDLASAAAISSEAIEQARLRKLQKKGGFSQGCFIDSVHMPNEDNVWVTYCRSAPHKYPEIKP